MRELIAGTRGSALALRQTDLVCDALRSLQPELRIRVERITTTGDARADAPLSALGRGVFVSEIEAALRAGRVDFAVHSAKDLPSTLAPGLVIAAFPVREDPRDVLVSRIGGGRLVELPSGARVGTSSPRRISQLRALRPDLDLRDMRGNVDTRLRKLADGEYDAIVLAAAGLVRLGRADAITEYLPAGTMIPCVGQGALAVEARADDEELLALLSRLDHPATRRRVTAERAFLAELGAGCLAAVAAHAVLDEDAHAMTLRGMIGDTGGRAHTSEARAPASEAPELGARLARAMLRDGAAGFLAAGDRPLRNRRVAVTRPAEQSRAIVALLEARGAHVLAYSTIAIEQPPAQDAAALERELRRLDSYDWIVFTSANAARVTGAALRRLDLEVPAGVKLAAVGHATARELEGTIGEPAFIASDANADALGRELPVSEGSAVLFPRGDLASAELARQLSGRGAHVRDVIAYRTVPGEGIDGLRQALAEGTVDAIVFASPSSVRFSADVLEHARAIGSLPALVCIGGSTARAVMELGWNVAVTSRSPSTADLVDAVERAVEGQRMSR